MAFDCSYSVDFDSKNYDKMGFIEINGEIIHASNLPVLNKSDNQSQNIRRIQLYDLVSVSDKNLKKKFPDEYYVMHIRYYGKGRIFYLLNENLASNFAQFYAGPHQLDVVEPWGKED